MSAGYYPVVMRRRVHGGMIAVTPMRRRRLNDDKTSFHGPRLRKSDNNSREITDSHESATMHLSCRST